ncbi:MAG: transglutaminase domain-containing protein [Bacteroidetes bacterium]|nr:transglutaminase domain-containing protein [Bacteroidota bacterium]
MRILILTLLLIAIDISVFGQDIDNIGILEKYPNYDTIKYSIPDFTYQSDKSIEIQTFKNRYKIDSIAGKGEEFEKQIRLLKWVNNSFKHNGNKPLVNKVYADSLILNGQKEGINCGGLAIIMNAVYLSMGFKSRFITCLNNDSIFNDPHSLTIVYSNKYNKWILVDPTYCVFFIDEFERPLSIEEIRIRLVNHLKIRLTDSFHLNSISTSAIKANDYYKYISRNMFRFISPIHNSLIYDLDCLEYVQLIPKGFSLNAIPLGKEMIDGCSKFYFIDNQQQFWK